MRGSPEKEKDPCFDIATEAIRRSIQPIPLENSVSGAIESSPSAFSSILRGRRSVREFADWPVSQAALERVMVDSAGGVRTVKDRKGQPKFLERTIPQSGAICSIATGLIVLRQTGQLDSGIYKFCPHSNSMHLFGSVDDASIRSIFLQPDDLTFPGNASAILTIMADLHLKGFKYGDRGHRYALIEVGCALQNALLSLADQGIGGYAYGGFDDRKLAELFKLSYPAEAVWVTAIIGSLARST